MLKRNLATLSLLFGTLMVLLSACKKEDIILNNGNQLRYLFLHLQTTPQSFTVTAGIDQTVTGNKGTLLKFGPQSFKDAQGNLISSGTINIELTEMYKPGDMIANRVATTTVGQRRLQSGGSVKVVASMNGNEVFTSGYSIGFQQPAYSDKPMALFYGVEQVDSAGTRVVWGDNTGQQVMETTKISTNTFYLFDTCTAFNWINCDYFYSAPDPKTQVKVTLPDNSYDAFNTQVYIVFPAINSVSSMDIYDPANHVFSLSHDNYMLPVGATIHIVTLGARNGSYFMDVQKNVTVTQGLNVSVTPATHSIDDIQAALGGL
ncbi:hypothetical protein [Taibaiella koreensis]|uniref:hypothetical protein n=1 Tax=Taibaiella koreensis TaxID=1268548 RepID=UPI000E59C848|nr:hypothetical protein [Taibaiella koreensis]